MKGIIFLNSKIVTLNLPISITRGELLGAKFWEPLLCMYNSFNFDRKTYVKFKCEVMGLIPLVFTVKIISSTLKLCTTPSKNCCCHYKYVNLVININIYKFKNLVSNIKMSLLMCRIAKELVPVPVKNKLNKGLSLDSRAFIG